MNRYTYSPTIRQSFIPFLTFIALTLAAVSCKDESPVKPEDTTGPGGTVAFGISLGESTRTAYGDRTGDSYRLEWSEGDSVYVAGNACRPGKDKAVYRVSEASGSMGTMNVTVDGGLVWKPADEAVSGDFIAFYPASAVRGCDMANRSFEAEIPDEQTVTVTRNGEKLSASPDMRNAVMIASAENISNGAKVPLTFSPIATVVEVTLNGPDESDEKEIAEVDAIEIEGNAGESLAGCFKVIQRAGQYESLVSENGERKNIVRVILEDETGLPVELKKGESVAIKIFLLPATTHHKDENLSLRVITADGKHHLKRISADMEAGKIHEVRLPSLPGNTDGDLSRWMSELPDSTYISDITFPGAWNAFTSHETFEGSTPLEQDSVFQSFEPFSLYKKGVRAFQIDLRMRRRSGSDRVDFALYKGVKFQYNKTLKKDCYSGSTATFPAILSRFIDSLEQKTDKSELVMISLNYGERGFEDDVEFDKARSEWMDNLISEYCGNVEGTVIAFQTYDGIHAISDIKLDMFSRGKILLVFNRGYGEQSSLEPKYRYMPTTSVPMAEEASGKICTSDIIAEGEDTKVDLRYVRGRRTFADSGKGPTILDRMQGIDQLLTTGYTLYGSHAATHDLWTSVGLGGEYVDNGLYDMRRIAKEFNPYMLKKIREMRRNGTIFPLGTVYMNFACDPAYSGDKLVRALIRLNRLCITKKANARRK